MVLFSGKISHLVLFCFYITASILLISESYMSQHHINHYEIELFQAKSFLDCEVDHDNNRNTCVSAYTLVPSIKLPIQIFLTTAFGLAALFRLGMFAVHQNHSFSVFKYMDNVSVNTILIFTMCVIGGIQEVKFISVITIAIFCIELLYAYHDFNLDTSITTSLYITTWILQVTIWFVILLATGFYVVNSHQLPIYIPLYVFIGIGFHIIAKLFHARFFYHLVPRKIGYDSIKTYETIRQTIPYYIDWSESWANIIYLLQRGCLIIFYVLLAKDYRIIYI